MDLNSLYPLFASLGPWGILIGIAIPILVSRFFPNLKLPSLPAIPVTPVQPTPAPPVLTPDPNSTPLKVDPLNISDRPWLRLLLSLLSVKSAGVTTASDSAVIDLLHRELTEVKDQVKALPPK